MNIQEAVKFVSELNKVTGEINRVSYESSPLLAGTMYNYQLTMDCGAMKDGGLIEKAFGLGTVLTDQINTPLANTACMLGTRVCLINRVGFKSAVIENMAASVASLALTALFNKLSK